MFIISLPDRFLFDAKWYTVKKSLYIEKFFFVAYLFVKYFFVRQHLQRIKYIIKIYSIFFLNCATEIQIAKFLSTKRIAL